LRQLDVQNFVANSMRFENQYFLDDGDLP
jgi:hypothetical protein